MTKKFMKTHPVWTVVLFPLAVILFVAVLESVTAWLIADAALRYAGIRIFLAVCLYMIFVREKTGWIEQEKRPTGEIKLLLPAGVLIAFNLLSDMIAGAEIGSVLRALFFSFAPGIYEEVIYRRIIVQNVYCCFGKGTRAIFAAVFLSSLSFGAIHILNLFQLGVGTTAIQMAYAFVIGIFFAICYLRIQKLLPLIVAHWAIDFSSEILYTADTSWTVGELAGLLFILVGLLVYSAVLLRKFCEEKALQGAINQSEK